MQWRWLRCSAFYFVGIVLTFCCAQDYSFFATAGNDGCVKIYDASHLSSQVVLHRRCSYDAQKGNITAITMCDNSQSFASASDNGSVHVVKVCATSSSLWAVGKWYYIRAVCRVLWPLSLLAYFV
jgi:WD40 repeat protein